MIWIRLGSVLMFLAVSLGAFGAHALRSRLSLPMQTVFETAVRYHVYHALALFAVAWLSQAHPHAFVRAAGYSFTAGIVLFSGSLYLLCLTGTSAWGAVTPFGGLAFLAGWGLLALARRPLSSFIARSEQESPPASGVVFGKHSMSSSGSS